MKKILIVSHAMELGGAENALLGLLETVDTEKYDVSLFLLRHKGELLSRIPEKIRILPEIPQYADLAVPISRVIKKGHFSIAFGRFKGKKAAGKFCERNNTGGDYVALEYSHKYTEKYMPHIPGEYDVVISFLTPHYFASDKVTAKKRIAFIHTDYSDIDIDVDSELKMWRRYDSIVAVSDKAKESFIKVFPSLSERTVVIENIMPTGYIGLSADSFSAESEMPYDGNIKLLSIGRFCYAKNFDSIPEICKLIGEQGMSIKWYLIGFGADKELIKAKIREFGMEERVVILGKKDNPYPYIKACDLYVQPSRYEGKSVSVREAQYFNKPVVITDYPTSKSQLENGVDGIIVPLDNGQCAKGIAKLLKDHEKAEELSRNCKDRDYTNKNEIVKFYELIES